MRKAINTLLVLSLPLLLSSCNWDGIFSFAWNFMCSLAPDSDHCSQFLAVQSGNSDKCAKIKWTKFKSGWSNPPRDKCYMQIAINKWDYTTCSKIQWWYMSYSKEECIKDVWKNILDLSVKNDDLEWCKKLSKFPTWYLWNYEECKAKLATPEKIKKSDSKMDDIIESLKKDPWNTELKKELDNLKKQKQATYDMMTDKNRADYFSEKRQEIMKDVEDEDVKSAISKEYTNYRSWEKDINKLLEKLQEVTEKQQTLKKLDEEANVLVDQVKEQLEWIVNDKQDEIIEEMWDKAKDRIAKNWWDNLKWSLKNMEYAMWKYEKWSKMYEDAKWKYDKLKWYYDEIMWVYDRVDQVNKMVAEWKIDAWKAKVLKWAVLLDKWLEYTTQYVPVFWSTISTISKETFWTVIKLAKKRAERSTAIEKCFDDPANCDTDSISGY